MKVAAIQHDIAWKDATGTCDTLRRRIANAAAGGAEMVVLAEMFATGYTVDPAEIAESAGGPIQQFMQQQASEHSIWLLGSVAVWSTTPGRAINRLIARVHAASGSTMTNVIRSHMPVNISTIGQATADLGDRRTSSDSAGVLRPSFRRRFLERGPGTDLFVVVANWPITRRTHWMTLLQQKPLKIRRM